MKKILLVLFLTEVHGWMNAMDKQLNYQCPDGSVIYEVNSKHDNFYEDRVFEILCRRPGGGTSNCQWTSDYVNAFDGEFSYECPNQGVLAGMQSIHDNQHEDRRWKFYCCQIPRTTLSQCQKLPKTQLDWAWSIFAPENHAFKGVSSRHDNYYEDREYEFEMCHVQ